MRASVPCAPLAAAFALLAAVWSGRRGSKGGRGGGGVKLGTQAACACLQAAPLPATQGTLRAPAAATALPPPPRPPPARRYACNVCQLVNEVPVEYFCALDAGGRRLDADQRPELCGGSVEYVAPAEYMVGLGRVGGRLAGRLGGWVERCRPRRRSAAADVGAQREVATL